MSEKLLELKNVTIKFGGVTALNEVNFHVNRGEICALIGPNGAGKTTVFNVVTGVYPVTSGEITFKGKNLGGLKRHQVTKAGLARTFQNVRLFGDMTALENVITATDVHKKTGLLRALIGTPLNRREEKESKERAHELLALMGIDHRADQLAKNLPYGDQRRLRSLAHWEQSQRFFFLMNQLQALTRLKRLSLQILLRRFAIRATQFFSSSTICRSLWEFQIVLQFSTSVRRLQMIFQQWSKMILE